MSDHRISTFGLPPESVARLLGLAAGQAAPGDPLTRRERMLASRFQAPLPLEPAVVERLPELMAQLCHRLAPMNGRSLHELMLDAATPEEVLSSIKDHFKKVATDCQDADEHSVAIAVYFAAIAAALVHYRRRISTQGLDTLASAFENLHDKAWVPEWLADLYDGAARSARALNG